jgi:hypothetical protein
MSSRNGKLGVIQVETCGLDFPYVYVMFEIKKSEKRTR